MAFARAFIGLVAMAAALIGELVPAFAHHVMGGKMPATFSEGLLSGIGHPIIGVDHFVFVVGVGLIAACMGRKWLLPAAFVLGTWAGAALHLARLDLPFAEVAILISILLAAIAVIANANLPPALTAGLVAVAGVFHGYAYAESIFGAEPTPLYAYLAGFAIMQFAIAVCAAYVLEELRRRGGAAAEAGMRVAGGAMLGVAMVSLSSMLFPLPPA
jgi:urease accessory protein